jgi:hypothetical protein
MTYDLNRTTISLFRFLSRRSHLWDEKIIWRYSAYNIVYFTWNVNFHKKTLDNKSEVRLLSHSRIDSPLFIKTTSANIAYEACSEWQRIQFSSLETIFERHSSTATFREDDVPLVEWNHRQTGFDINCHSWPPKRSQNR